MPRLGSSDYLLFAASVVIVLGFLAVHDNVNGWLRGLADGEAPDAQPVGSAGQ